MRRPLAAGSSSPGMAAAARASPANKASRRRHLRLWIGRTGTVASDVYMPNPARMVIDRRSDAQRPSPTRRRTQGDRHATRTHRRGQVAGSPDRGRAGDGDSNQLLAVPRGHRPHGGGRQRVEVTVSLTLLAVARAEPGWPQPDRYHRWAAVLVVAHSASALVAVGLPRLRLPWLEWRPRAGARDQGQGSRHHGHPEAATPGLPGESGANRAPLGVAAKRWSSYAQLRSHLPLAGGLGPGPL